MIRSLTTLAPGGRIPAAPPANETQAGAAKIAALIEKAREELV
jgi:hypothetical protein